jgi:hypothetical protein
MITPLIVTIPRPSIDDAHKLIEYEIRCIDCMASNAFIHYQRMRLRNVINALEIALAALKARR